MKEQIEDYLNAERRVRSIDSILDQWKPNQGKVEILIQEKVQLLRVMREKLVEIGHIVIGNHKDSYGG